MSVVFTPPSGARNVVLLANDCTGIGTCAGAASTTCIPGPAAGLALVSHPNGTGLGFRFPVTSFAGPASVAVTRVGDPLPCGLVTAGCRTQTGLVACIDDFFVDDGNCGTRAANREATFRHFTGLPTANDFAALCFEDAPCNPTAPNVRATLDQAGNLLLPVNWQGILVNDAGVPVPRTLRATLAPPVPIKPPSQAYLASYTPEGGLLPPIFVPQNDATAPGGALTLFGTADAPYTVLRLARRVDACAGGVKQGVACLADADCPGSTCPTTCAGGPNDGAPCTSDAQCTPARCGRLFDLAPLAGTGPLVLNRLGPGVCQTSVGTACSANGQCGADAPCVGYALQAQTPVPLDGLVQTGGVFAFVVNESVAAAQLNGDADMLDSVVTLRERETGVVQAIGNEVACGVSQSPQRQGRAVQRIAPVADSPAVAAEGDLVAFLESEPDQNVCDANGDGDVFDSVLRMFRLGPTEVRPAANLAVDAAPIVNDRSLAVSSGRVFVRTPEGAGGRNVSELASVDSSDVQGAEQSVVSPIGSGIISGGGPATQIYVRDLSGPTTERVSVDGTTPGNGDSNRPFMSADGRWVVFESMATNLDPAANNGLNQIISTIG